MTTILTRAARALCKAQSGDDVYDDLEPEAQEAARKHVRAVLEAIREPSEEMLARTVAMLPDEINRATGAWQAMIDAALAD